MAALQLTRSSMAKLFTSRAPLLGPRAGQFRGAIYTNRDWKPGPYPKTEAERRAAAKKYNMLYEDYEPYPVGHPDHLGDYPMLPPIGIESKDPYYDYDIPMYRRNYGEPVHTNFEWYIRERYDVTNPHRYSFAKRFGAFVAVFLGLIGGHMLLKRNDFIVILTPVPAMKQYPKEGVTHYTFEPAD